MTGITEQLDQLHDEIAVLAKLRSHQIAAQLMSQLAGTKVKTLVIQAARDQLVTAGA